MHNSEKIFLKFGKEYIPKLYYILKYRKNKQILDNKLKKLREYLYYIFKILNFY